MKNHIARRRFPVALALLPSLVAAALLAGSIFQFRYEPEAGKSWVL